MARTVKIAASLVGSLWWEVADSLRRVLAEDEVTLDIDWTRYDHLSVRAVAAGECEIGVTMPPFVDWAKRKRGALSDLDAKHLRVIAAVNLSTWLVAAVDGEAGVQTLRELGEAKFPWKPIMPPDGQLLRVWGGDDPPPYARELRHEAKDDGLPAHWVSDRASEPMRFLEMEEEALRTVQEELGVQRFPIPDIPTIGWRHQYVYGREDTDPELVRTNLGALERPKFLDNAMGVSYTAVELHPASIEWYRGGHA